MTEDRAISLNAVIKAVDKHTNDDGTLDDDISCILEDIPSAEPKWIPCEERLPKEGKDVLACFYTGEGNYKMIVSRRSDYNYWSGVGRTADMVAWMPLPKPYTAESEDKECII